MAQGHGAEGLRLDVGVYAEVHQGAGQRRAERLPARIAMGCGLAGEQARLELDLQRRPIHMGVEPRLISVANGDEELMDVARRLEPRHGGASGDEEADRGSGQLAKPLGERWPPNRPHPHPRLRLRRPLHAAV